MLSPAERKQSNDTEKNDVNRQQPRKRDDREVRPVPSIIIYQKSKTETTPHCWFFHMLGLMWAEFRSVPHKP